MNDYIKQFPPLLLEEMVAGRWLPFLGAGFSVNANVPVGLKMPLWSELGKQIASDIPDCQYSGPVDALSNFESLYGRPKLVEKLLKLLLVNSAKPGDVHGSFCRLPFDKVCTTNFDFLIEAQYEAQGRHCIPLVNESQVSVSGAESDVTLIKLHGDLHHPAQLIVTEEDYRKSLEPSNALTTYLTSLLMIRTPIFIGYSLDDPDLRHVWDSIGDRLGTMRRKAFAIMVGADAETIKGYEDRGVKVVNLPGSVNLYGAILDTLFYELNSYWQRISPKVKPETGKRGNKTDDTLFSADNRGKVKAVNGNIIYLEQEGTEPIKLTSDGIDSEPSLSPDGKKIVFVRTTQSDIPMKTKRKDAEPKYVKKTKLCTINIGGTEIETILEEADGKYPKTTLTWFRSPQYSPNGGSIYFLSSGWATSGGVRVVNLANGEVRLVCAGNTLEVIYGGDYSGYLMVRQHRYFMGGGSYDWEWLIKPDGESVAPIAGDDDTSHIDGSGFRDLYVPRYKKQKPIAK